MSRPAIIVHGGCGKVEQSSIPERLQAVEEAAKAAWKLLLAGGSAVDAVEAAVLVLEDNPLFNAGTGSALNSEGRIEADAAIMDGARLDTGAVAAVTGIANPIRLARRVMEVGPPVFLVAKGAEQFARSQGMAQCPLERLVTSHRRQEWEDEHGTVGASACDTVGRLAAATSTGGHFNKLPGRVGDSPARRLRNIRQRAGGHIVHGKRRADHPHDAGAAGRVSISRARKPTGCLRQRAGAIRGDLRWRNRADSRRSPGAARARQEFRQYADLRHHGGWHRNALLGFLPLPEYTAPGGLR